MLATTIQITNNPPHTTHTNNIKPPAGCAGNHHPQGSGRSHGVEREPDSVLVCHKTIMPNPNKTHPHPPPTMGSERMQAQEEQPTTPATWARAVKELLPHTTGLPRKEVIQPHLPVRLPCYDFVPIANPTFDHSPRKKRLGHGLRVLPTFVT